MGYIRHNAIVVTGYDNEELEVTRLKVCAIINECFAENRLAGLDPPYSSSMVTSIVESKTNGYCTFFVGPDGSKEGWDTSDAGDSAREKIVLLLTDERLTYAEISYGDEAGPARIINES